MNTYSKTNKSLLTTLIIVFTLTINQFSYGQCIDEQFTTAVLAEYNFGQSFTVPVGCSSTLDNIVLDREHNTNHSGTNPALTLTLYLYAGQTVSGSPLYTQSGISIAAGTGDRAIIVSGGTGSRTINANSVYTIYFVIDPVPSLTIGVRVGQNSGSEDYLGGDCYFVGSFRGTHDLDMVINSTSLPVELTAFDAKQQENSIALNWETASEKNNEGFEIQRSENGEKWETLDFVLGNGTTQEMQNYSFTDEFPLVDNNYYRLKQMDFDGQFEYSHVVNVGLGTVNYELRIFPNPVQNELNIVDAQGQATIYNVLGQTIKTFDLDGNMEIISLGDIPKGAYYLEIIGTNNQKTVKQFIKQ